MEYVNIYSLQDPRETSAQAREGLLAKYDSITPADQIIATDTLELLRGKELVKEARTRGDNVVPLRRACTIKPTRNFPKRVLLELTSECNSSCSMCPRHFLTRPKMHMETSLAKKVIRELAETGISGLWLYNIGESLLHPGFFEILDYCRQFDTLGTLWLSTNGQIMDEDMQRRVLDHPVDILNYSVNAMTAESFRRVTPQLDFDQVQRNLWGLIKMKKKLGKIKPVIRAQMIEMPYVLGEIATFKETFGDQADILAFNKLEEFSQNINRPGPDHNGSLNPKIERCNRLEREDFFIASNGTMTCCDTDFNCSLNIGNVQEQSIRDIYEGPRYQGLIRKYRAGRLQEEPLCSGCRDFQL